MQPSLAGYIAISEEVRTALEGRKPVVALESTVAPHDFSFPENLETVRQMEAAARRAGAVPAIIGLVDGKIVVGLNAAQLERLAQEKDVFKVSRRDFAQVLVKKGLGATTVAASMLVCFDAGIRLFATGGIGGVHRGASQTFDVSADLNELSHTPVGVVCSGPNAVLDIGLTLEVLETLGVPLIGYCSPEIPAFYSRESGHSLEYCYTDHQEMARVLQTHWGLGMQSGVLITNPPPREAAMKYEEVEELIEKATHAAGRRAIRGKAVTPFLLDCLSRATHGKTLRVNKALLVSNAEAAARIAVEYTQLIG